MAHLARGEKVLPGHPCSLFLACSLGRERLTLRSSYGLVVAEPRVAEVARATTRRHECGGADNRLSAVGFSFSWKWTLRRSWHESRATLVHSARSSSQTLSRNWPTLNASRTSIGQNKDFGCKTAVSLKCVIRSASAEWNIKIKAEKS